MDGLTLLQEAGAAGLTVTQEGGLLKLRGPRRADAIARRLIAHKPVVLGALAAAALPEPPPNVSPWDLPGEWRERWEERAAIMEYEGKMPLERAEFLALGDILQQMKHAGVALPACDI